MNKDDRKPFTPADGIRYQQEDLELWATVLKPEIMALVRQRAEEKNHQAFDGYAICRGDSITEIVYLIRHRLRRGEAP